jgi:hypothetical protein
VNNFTEDEIDNYIAEVQEKILKDLLGHDLYMKFGATLPTPTSGTKYDHLLNGVVYVDPKKAAIETFINSEESVDDGLDLNVDYTGLERMLKLFTYYSYAHDQVTHNTMLGNVKGSSQNGAVLDNGEMLARLELKYNIAIDLYREARKFILDHRDMETTSTSVTNNGDGTYTFAVPSTKYLVNGDTVNISGQDYTISSLVANTSFKITESETITFAAATLVKYDAFPTFQGKKKDKMFLNNSL